MDSCPTGMELTCNVLGLSLEPGCSAPQPAAQPCSDCMLMSLGGRQMGLMCGAMSTRRFSRTTATSNLLLKKVIRILIFIEQLLDF